MADQKKAVPANQPATPDALIREVRALAPKRGWTMTSSMVDDVGAVVVSFAPTPTPEDTRR